MGVCLIILFFKINTTYLGTGDNIRHDNDHKIPRTTKEIYDLNRAVARKMEEVFVRKGVPVVPSLGELLQYSSYNLLTIGCPPAGNNDVWREQTHLFSPIYDLMPWCPCFAAHVKSNPLIVSV